MEEITIFDGIVAFVMLFSGILAYSRGLLRETLAIAGWIVAAIGAFFIAPMATPLVHEIPFLSDIIGSSCELSIISAFIVTFILILIVVSVLVPVLSGTVRSSALGGIDQMLGLMFGILRGLVLILVVLIVHDRLVPKGDGIGMIEDSMTKQLLSTSQAGIETQIPNNARNGSLTGSTNSWCPAGLRVNPRHRIRTLGPKPASPLTAKPRRRKPRPETGKTTRTQDKGPKSEVAMPLDRHSENQLEPIVR